MTERHHALELAIEDVIDFHVATDMPVAEFPCAKDDGPIIQADRRELRIRLIEEEVKETIDAMREGYLIEIADGLADIIYVCIGAALEYGIPLADVWDEVQRSNMAKINPATGKADKRADGKVIKPEGWTPPDIASILGEYTS